MNAVAGNTTWPSGYFRFEKDFNFYLNSSHAAPKVGISVSLQQAAGNSNLDS